MSFLSIRTFDVESWLCVCTEKHGKQFFVSNKQESWAVARTSLCSEALKRDTKRKRQHVYINKKENKLKKRQNKLKQKRPGIPVEHFLLHMDNASSNTAAATQLETGSEVKMSYSKMF